MELEAKHALSTIHSSMNTFPKINRLPPEVLALIPYFLTDHKDLVFTTHVCRHWRNTIIASPPLWSSLDNETIHKDLVAAYIDRCGGTPLDVNFSSDSDKNTSFLKKIILHSSHIHRIRIPFVPWYHIAEISDGFETPLPLLRDVDLNIGYDLSPPPFERPFLAGATNLLSLRLSDYNINSGTLLHFIIPTLTHLSLLFSEPRIPMVGELLEFFRNSPLIEDLQVHADVVLDSGLRKAPVFPIGSNRSISPAYATYTLAGPRHDLNIPSSPTSNTHPIVPSLCKCDRTATLLKLRRTCFQNHGTPSPFRTSVVSHSG